MGGDPGDPSLPRVVAKQRVESGNGSRLTGGARIVVRGSLPSPSTRQRRARRSYVFR
jgi:hypothetical protein